VSINFSQSDLIGKYMFSKVEMGLQNRKEMMSNMDLQREQIIDVMFSFSCFVLMIWHDEVLVCVYVCVCVCIFVEI